MFLNSLFLNKTSLNTLLTFFKNLIRLTYLVVDYYIVPSPYTRNLKDICNSMDISFMLSDKNESWAKEVKSILTKDCKPRRGGISRSAAHLGAGCE